MFVFLTAFETTTGVANLQEIDGAFCSQIFRQHLRWWDNAQQMAEIQASHVTEWLYPLVQEKGFFTSTGDLPE